MKNKTLIMILLCLFLKTGCLSSQTGPETYVWPKDATVLENLKKWQGYKFGLLIHMGLYSELGTRDEKQLPSLIIVRTKLPGKLKVSLLENKQTLNYQRFDDVLMVAFPASLRSTLAAKEAVVIKVINQNYCLMNNIRNIRTI